MNTIILYSVVGILSVIFAKDADRREKGNIFFVCLVILLLSLLAGVRSYNVGIDTKNYVQLFSSIYDEHASFEKVFIVIIKLISKVTNNYTVLLCLFSVATNSLIVIRFWQLREVASFHWTILCYYILFYFNTMSGIRQCLAVAMVFFFSRYIIEEWNTKGFFIGIIFAMFIHRTALIGVLLMAPKFFRETKIHRMKVSQLLVVIAMPLVAIVGISLVQDRYVTYISQTTSFNLGYMAFVRLILVMLISYQLLITYNKQEENQHYQLGACLFSEYAVLFAVIISYFLPNVWRIGWYFWLYSPVLYSFYLSKKAYGSTVNVIIRLGIIAILIVTWISIINGFDSKLIPYEFFWQVNDL